MPANESPEFTKNSQATPSIQVEVPATSANLGPGFDCLGIALSLVNTLELRLSERDELLVSGEGASQLTGHSTSLAHRAARAVWDELELGPTGFALSMNNAIPFARGLGSSSAAIVAGLFAANEWARAFKGAALSQSHLLNLATRIEGHPDNVAPALLGGVCVCATREDGEVFCVSSTPAFVPRFVVWIPEVELSTEKARGALPTSYSRADCVFNISRSSLLVAALAQGDEESLAEALRDRIHQDYRASLVPGWDQLGKVARDLGAIGVTLSGAGPTILFWLSPQTDPSNFVTNLREQATFQGLKGRALELQLSSGARLLSSSQPL